MRARFEQQLKLGITPISEIQLDRKSRHSLVPVLRALQHVFVNPALSEEIFQILEDKVKSGIKNTGRNGMSLWEILVLGVVRHSENSDYDRLYDLANNHSSLRGILGVHKSDYTIDYEYNLQTIKDNVRLLDEETIHKISAIVVKGSHGLIKKKEGVDCLSLQIKADSFVVESNIHFPTDLNLLWDSLRKSLESMAYFQSELPELRSTYQCKRWTSKARSAYRTSSEIHRKKGGNYQQRLEVSVGSYLKIGQEIVKRGNALLEDVMVNYLAIKDLSSHKKGRVRDFTFYLKMVEKHLDLVCRRIILGEKIPHKEKVFSIFEPHVEWNSKGKVNKGVELGHNVLIATDQYGHLLYSEVYESQVDKGRTINLGNKIADSYGKEHELESISLDRNFYSLPAEQSLQKQFKLVVLPKSGQASKLELSQGENVDYQNRKRKHACIEGNINQLEQNSLDVCPDKGIDGFKRYVAYGVVSYNLHRLGMLLIRAEREEAKRAERKRKRRRAA